MSTTPSDVIENIVVSLYQVPLKKPVSDAKVLTGRQVPLSHVAMLTAEITTRDGARGLGFSYCLRSGSAALFAHAKELAPGLIGEDPADIGRLWEKLAWMGGSISRTGLSVQAIAAFDTALWDIKARRANLSLGRLLGAYRTAVPCYNTSGGYLSATLPEIYTAIEASLARGIGGIKLKVGQPDVEKDIERVRAVRQRVGNALPLMVDANQQWDLTTALRAGRALDEFRLTWIEEPLNAHDYAGHALLGSRIDTPVSTGEMLCSAEELYLLLDQQGARYLQPDAGRIGGITPFLKVSAQAERQRLNLAPHFLMEIHIHLAAAYPYDTWVEHIEWLEPAFNERLEISGGCMHLPERPGLGLSLSERAAGWLEATAAIGR